MTNAYLCPNCKTNRTRFNLIQQEPQPVQLDPKTGEVLQESANTPTSPFHMQYQGPDYKVQCGVCGLLETEKMFTNYATYMQGKELT